MLRFDCIKKHTDKQTSLLIGLEATRADAAQMLYVVYSFVDYYVLITTW